MEQDDTRPALADLQKRLNEVRQHAAEVERGFAPAIDAVDPCFRESARNLVHYLALRHFDLRDIQGHLSAMGLSTLGDVEAHTMASIDAVRGALEPAAVDNASVSPGVRIEEGPELLVANTEALMGTQRDDRYVRIMVTIPTEAAENYDVVRDLMTSGMDCARINCARDDETTWTGMVEHIKRAKEELGRDCKIFMDLAGPKLRLGGLEPGPRVTSWQPTFDARGKATAPAALWFAHEHLPRPSKADAVIPVSASWLAQAQPNDCVRFRDANGVDHEIVITNVQDDGCLGEIWRAAHIETGTELELHHTHGEPPTDPTTRVSIMPEVEVPLWLAVGDTLVLHKDQRLGEPAVRTPDGTLVDHAHVSCTMPEVFDDVNVGDAVMIDDGKISGIARSVTGDEIRVAVTLTKPGGQRLRGHKGINFPDTHLHVSAITRKDLADLDFVVRHADAVDMSFANEPGDVLTLLDELEKRDGRRLGLVLKIETKRGFYQLPWLLLAGMQGYPIGVMIARGDLAVECGWERLAEMQEEILWFCEAAHIPVIWATQVLEHLAKKGFPSRAEVTDAAMAERAECVMLNKGPYILRAVETLDHILRRMEEHHEKKIMRLRRLTLAHAAQRRPDGQPAG